MMAPQHTALMSSVSIWMKPLEVPREMWFHHDGAPAHCTNVVCEYLDETFGSPS
jgi:hypothetical protein